MVPDAADAVLLYKGRPPDAVSAADAATSVRMQNMMQHAVDKMQFSSALPQPRLQPSPPGVAEDLQKAAHSLLLKGGDSPSTLRKSTAHVKVRSFPEMISNKSGRHLDFPKDWSALKSSLTRQVKKKSSPHTRSAAPPLKTVEEEETVHGFVGATVKRISLSERQEPMCWLSTPEAEPNKRQEPASWPSTQGGAAAKSRPASRLHQLDLLSHDRATQGLSSSKSSANNARSVSRLKALELLSHDRVMKWMSSSVSSADTLLSPGRSLYLPSYCHPLKSHTSNKLLHELNKHSQSISAASGSNKSQGKKTAVFVEKKKKMVQGTTHVQHGEHANRKGKGTSATAAFAHKLPSIREVEADLNLFALSKHNASAKQREKPSPLSPGLKPVCVSVPVMFGGGGGGRSIAGLPKTSVSEPGLLQMGLGGAGAGAA